MQAGIVDKQGHIIALCPACRETCSLEIVVAVTGIIVCRAFRSAAVGKLHIDDVAHVLLAATAEHTLDAHTLEACLIEIDGCATYAEVVTLGEVVGHIGHELFNIGVFVGTEGEQLIVINVDAVVQIVGVDEVALGINGRNVERAIVEAAQLALVNKVNHLGICGCCSVVHVVGDEGLVIFLLNVHASNDGEDVVSLHVVFIEAKYKVVEDCVIGIETHHVQEQAVTHAQILVARECHHVAVLGQGALHDTVGD